MHKRNLLIFALGIFFLLSFKDNSYSQEIKIELGKNEIALNEAFTITVTVQNDRLKSYDDFPEIPGMVKQGTSSSSSTNIINGKISSSHSITQNYSPTSQGSYILKPFTMEVNGQSIKSQGITLNVGPPQQRARNNDPFNMDPFEDFFGRGNQGPQEYIDIEEDAFLALSTDKNEVYVGEGFTVSLAFYLGNRAPMQFHEPGKQLSEILKKIKPANSWEENFNIENINGKPVEINGKQYIQYKIYQATFYPLNQENIRFPSVGFDMIKYKVAKNPSFFGRNRKEEIKTYHSKSKTVKVKALPPHPLRDMVAVGDYRLKEDISSKNLETGQSFSYNFNIIGEGNISAITNPLIPQNQVFEFYSPNVRQNINRAGNRVTGSKSFTYYAIPHEPGAYDLGDYVNWIYFNPQKAKYDTLRSSIQVKVTGESKKNQYISSTDMGTFYDIIELENNTLEDRNRDQRLKLFANIIIFLMLVLTIIIIFKT
ncbi:MAG: BatD family protein [Candidatus Cyclobacteriaceae bacterium M3_2C_046]